MENYKDIFSSWVENDFLQRMVIILLCMVFVYFIDKALKRSLSKNVKSNENKYRVRKVISLFTYFLFSCVLLFVFRDKVGNIGATMGVIGAGVAFALQEVIISIAGWLNIIFTNNIMVGQRVRIANVKGDVIDIGVLSTIIMETGDWIDGDLYNGSIVTIANSFVFKERVHNYSAEYPFLWDEVTVPIRTDSDYHLARKIFTEVLNDICGDFSKASAESWTQLTNKYRIEEAQVAPMVTLSFDENWITFTLRYIVNYKKRRTTKDLIYTRLLDEIAEQKGLISIAASTLEVSTASDEKE